MATNISPEQVQAVLKKLGFNPTLEQATTLIDLLTSITIAVIREQAEKQLIADELELLSPPGDTIKETMDEMGIDKVLFGMTLGVMMPQLTTDEIHGLFNGDTVITPDIANSLQYILDIDAQFWLNRDRDYRSKLFALQNKQL